MLRIINIKLTSYFEQYEIHVAIILGIGVSTFPIESKSKAVPLNCPRLYGQQARLALPWVHPCFPGRGVLSIDRIINIIIKVGWC